MLYFICTKTSLMAALGDLHVVPGLFVSALGGHQGALGRHGAVRIDFLSVPIEQNGALGRYTLLFDCADAHKTQVSSTTAKNIFSGVSPLRGPGGVFFLFSILRWLRFRPLRMTAGDDYRVVADRLEVIRQKGTRLLGGGGVAASEQIDGHISGFRPGVNR